MVVWNSDLLKSSEEYSEIKDIMENIIDYNTKFSLDIINFLSYKLYGIKDIINLNKLEDAQKKMTLKDFTIQLVEIIYLLGKNDY